MYILEKKNELWFSGMCVIGYYALWIGTFIQRKKNSPKILFYIT